MSAAGEHMTVRLSGGGPWGFRLQGGAGTGQPLTVAKIRRKSRSHKNLFENDLIISINDQSCAGLTYDEAMNIVDTAGTTLLIKIIRPPKGKENIAPPPVTDSGKTYSNILKSETDQKIVLSDEHTSEKFTRRFENVAHQTEHQDRRHLETSPQPSKPFPDITETFGINALSRAESPPVNQRQTSPEISPPLPKQPNPSLHRPLFSSFSPPDDRTCNSVEPLQSRSAIVTQKTQMYTQINQQQRQHCVESVLHPSKLNSEQHYTQVQPHHDPQKANPNESLRQFETTELYESATRQSPSDRPQAFAQPLRQYQSVQKSESVNDQTESLLSTTTELRKEYRTSEDQSNPSEPFEKSWQQTIISQSSQALPKHLSVPYVPVQSPVFQPQSADPTLFKAGPLRITESNVTHTWRPGFSSTETKETIRIEVKEPQNESKKNVPPPIPPKPKQRPLSAPPMDIDIFKVDHLETPLVSMGAKTTDVMKVKGFPSHIFYPPEEDEMDTSLFTRRRKMYSSSSFYEEPGSIYPTVEEQVELCRKIADSLSADTNKKSRGANMFYKRVKRSHKWIHEGPDRSGSDGGFTSDSDYDSSTPDLSKMDYIKVSKGPPQLKLIMAPKPVQDVVKLKTQGQSISEHNVLSPDICLGLVRDLNSPCGKGAAMFAKRKQKAEDWVVDEQKVKAQVAQLAAELPPPSKTPDFPWTARLRLLKSPWAAALESPIGSCDAAFSEVTSVGRADAFADSLKRAAENKIRNQPNGPPPPLLATLTNDLCMPKAPKGWMGTTTTEIFPSLETLSSNDAYDPVAAKLAFEPVVAPRNLAFHDFNTRPTSWSPGGPTSARGFRSVKPPTR